MPSLLSKVFGTKNDREIKRLQPLVHAINELEPEIQALSDEQLRGKTEEFRRRIQIDAFVGRYVDPLYAFAAFRL